MPRNTGRPDVRRGATAGSAVLGALAVLALGGGCGADEAKPPTDSCGRIWRQCGWNERTMAFDRDCTFVAPPDGGALSCDGGVDGVVVAASGGAGAQRAP
jgi:hypothetical protein